MATILDALTLDADPLTLDADQLQLSRTDVVVVPAEGSSVARWSYTATATHWARTGLDDWTRQANFAAPVQFLCDYKIERDVVGAGTMSGGTGELSSRMVIYTGRANIRRGDFVLIGDSAALSPIGVDGAREVRSVTQFGDVFERLADDFQLETA